MTKPANESPAHSHTVAYRLLGSPMLRDEHRSARILGALARMELGPVTCAWFSQRTGLKPRAAYALLEDICAQGCAKRIPIPGAEPDSTMDGMSQINSTDFDALEQLQQRRPTRLATAYEFLRRVVR